MHLKIQTSETEAGQAIVNISGTLDAELDPIHDIVDYIVRLNDVSFKSQQVNECDLSNEDKRNYLFNMYKKSKPLFLSRFGKYMKYGHLSHFTQSDTTTDDAYKISQELKRLERYHTAATRKTDIRNRRYKALQKLIEEGSYFSEKEMMHRNPLLYEELIGRYLSESEKQTRDKFETKNMTFVNIILHKIDKDAHSDHLKELQESEHQVIGDINKDTRKAQTPIMVKQWGEFDDEKDLSNTDVKEDCSSGQENVWITAAERNMLRNEFIQEMYSSFVDGRDSDFSYEVVDCEDSYDDIEVYDLDQEEQYFDSESPEAVLMNEDHKELLGNGNAEESEDELDIYMRHLNDHHSIY